MGAPLSMKATPKAIMGPPPAATPGSEKSVSFQISILGPRPKQIIVNNVKVLVASDNEVKQFYKPLSKPGVGFSKPNFRSKTPPPRRVINNYPHPKTLQPKRNIGRQNQPRGFPVTWNNFQRQSYMPWEMYHPFPHPNQLHRMQGMFSTNNFGPMRLGTKRLRYGYCKNLKKTVKTGQTRTRERKSTQKAGRKLSKVKSGQLKST
ncbi:hypothetical protein Tco_1003206 [Tanacetum coccineum]|uniref:Uncharacterized protein n=1 Tax=Tanacetum coccineum TaxID=301880 RepID=A0ABQ5F9X6_9ASTR